MCEFVSWIEKDDEVLFLTGEDVFHTKRGKELQKYCSSKDDLTGHGAIRWYFAKDDIPLQGGKEKECTDFSTPDNFPKAIVKAIKRGEMAGFQDDIPLELLMASAWAEYEKVAASALAEYEKVRAPARAEYNKVSNNKFWALFADVNNRNPKWR